MNLQRLNLSDFRWRHSAFVWIFAATAHGQVSGWLDFDGKIPGESLHANHANWIEIRGFSIGGELHANQPGKLGFTKLLDRASPLLLQAVASGRKYPKATLDLNVFTADPRNTSPVRIELEDLSVFSNSIASGGESTTEKFELAFGRIIYTYVLDPRAPVVTNYDFRFRTGSAGTGSNPDTDSDGLPDEWERIYGFEIGQNNAAGDPDGDGLTNLQEYQLGTDPKSGTSFFKASLAPVSETPGTWQLSWNSVIGKNYIIEWSPDLVTPFARVRMVTASATTSTESITNAGNVGFYRVRPE
ncbi:MAG: type VI secretion system tube protein Hcp [Verrucomicrobiaceae bacterium]|nr:MAG: type VI secretion system tube protein Hcp [Verrucomicrobiaceae bacterium]